MTRQEFLIQFWRYYISLEKDFIQLTRYIELNKENFNVFSDEIHKQLLSVGVEFENICKKICDISNIPLPTNPTVDKFTEWLPEKEKIEINVIYSSEKITLFPFKKEKNNEDKLKWWWNTYNDVKHDRILNYKKGTFKNLLNGLASLFYAEMFLVKKIGELNNDIDVPDEYSKLFKIKGWMPKHATTQVGIPFATDEDIEEMLEKYIK